MFKVQRSKLRAGNLKRRKSRGLSLVELIVFMVIVSAAVAGVLGVMNVTTRASADPMIHKQALAIAEAVLEEVQLQPFTYCDPDDPAARTVDSAGATAIALSGAAITGVVTTGNLTMPSWTPAANELVLLGIAKRDETKSASVSGNNLTWTLIQEVDNVQGQTGVELWKGIGASPATGSISITFTANTLPVAAIAQRFSGTDTASPVEAFAGNAGPASDNDDMLHSVTTVTPNAWAVAFGTHRLADFTVPAGDTAAISVNLTAGSSGDTTTASMWYEGPVATPASTQLGALNDLDSDRDWSMVVVSVKPAGTCPTLAEAIGPEASESRYSTVLPFDNVNDYHGFDSNVAQSGLTGIRNIDSSLIDGLDGYRVTVSVAGQPLGAIGNDVNGFPQSLLITVTVTGPGNTTVTLNGYRTRHAPNALP